MADLTPKAIFEEKIAEKLKTNPDVTKINSIYQFNITGDNGGAWHIDLTKPVGEVGCGANPGAKCTITMKDTDFVAMITGTLNSQMAFMTGRLKVQGDMGLAMKLQKVIG